MSPYWACSALTLLNASPLGAVYRYERPSAAFVTRQPSAAAPG